MVVILGAGIAGISAAYHLQSAGIDCLIFEKDDQWGGLCGNFTIDGFRFDTAIHLSFTNDPYVKKIFQESSEYIAHKPLAYNYYYGYWLKHPVQNNLYPLPAAEKIKIITDFVESRKEEPRITNYEEWLRSQYGNYFSEHFPLPYTRKYWTFDAADLSVSWIGSRMYRPNIEEVLKGAFEPATPNFYYADEMRYPVKGGYKKFIHAMASQCDIRLNMEVKKIDINNKCIKLGNGEQVQYDQIISTLPLPEYMNIIDDIPYEVENALKELRYTSVALVSIGLNAPAIPRYLWFYVYDEEILAARCYSPSIKSPDNTPQESSSLQFEIYYSNNKPLSLTLEELKDHVIEKSIAMGIFKKENVVVADCRTIKYGNVVFYKKMEEWRNIIIKYLEDNNIIVAGRFGKWDYYWSDQSLISGKTAAMTVGNLS